MDVSGVVGDSGWIRFGLRILLFRECPLTRLEVGIRRLSVDRALNERANCKAFVPLCDIDALVMSQRQVPNSPRNAGITMAGNKRAAKVGLRMRAKLLMR